MRSRKKKLAAAREARLKEIESETLFDRPEECGDCHERTGFLPIAGGGWACETCGAEQEKIVGDYSGGSIGSIINLRRKS